MDITKHNLLANMGNILFLIGRSDFIAIDLEMSGISTKKSRQGGFKSMAEVYESAREAASTFQVVQLGLTFVCFVETPGPAGTNNSRNPNRRNMDSRGSYKTFTVSIPISPMFETSDPISAQMAEVTDRQLSFSYASLLVLEKGGFDLKSTFANGVPYLSVEESEQIEDAMLGPKTDDHEYIDPETVGAWAVTFYDHLRGELSGWLGTAGDMTGRKYKVFDPQGTGILRKTTVKLVRQLVREEFPSCRCFRDKTDQAMTIRRIADRPKEHTDESSFSKDVAKRLFQQQGVNLIVDALMAFSFKLLAMDDADKSYPDVEILRAFNITDTGMSWDSLVLMAGASNHVMIGHNVLHDLCFLYTMAIGRLPESMKLFCGLINGKLSRVIDTKVMAAQMTDEDAVDERLEDLFNLFKLQKNDPHGRSISSWGYNVENRSIGSGRGVAHEAGFDSYMTAIVFLKAAYRQYELQLEEHTAQIEHGQVHKWPERWLKDPARQDPGLFTRASPIRSRLPGFGNGFFRPVANRLRMSTVGLLLLGPVENIGGASGVETTYVTLPVQSTPLATVALPSDMNQIRMRERLDEARNVQREATRLRESRESRLQSEEAFGNEEYIHVDSQQRNEW